MPDLRDMPARLRALAGRLDRQADYSDDHVTDEILTDAADELRRSAADLEAALAGAFPVVWGRERTNCLVIPMEPDHD